MSDSYMIITEKDWEKATPEQRDWMVFNTIQKMGCRLRKLERRPVIDKIYAFAGGIIGGALAYLGIKIS